MMGQTKALGLLKTTKVATTINAPDWRDRKTEQNIAKGFESQQYMPHSQLLRREMDHLLANLEQCEIIEANVPV